MKRTKTRIIVLVDKNLDTHSVQIHQRLWQKDIFQVRLGRKNVFVSRGSFQGKCRYAAFTSKPVAEEFIGKQKERARIFQICNHIVKHHETTRA